MQKITNIIRRFLLLFNFKKSPINKKKLSLIFIGITIIGIVIFNCFYFSNKIEKIYSFPSFSIKKIDGKKSAPIEENIPLENFGIKIDKIGVTAPIIANVSGEDKKVYNTALKEGLAHMKGTSLPGQGSNIFIFGHSSSVVGTGTYSKIFADLNKLQIGDKIIVFYKEKEFDYSVFEKKVVNKKNIEVINPTNKEQLTLMTCWPIGTADKRLIIKSSLVQ